MGKKDKSPIMQHVILFCSIDKYCDNVFEKSIEPVIDILDLRSA